jgi:protein-tyrosine phosphatase
MRLNERLAEEGVGVSVVSGAEVSYSHIPVLAQEELERLVLGAGPYLLVESPYGQVPEVLENLLDHLVQRGFSPVLAHPERSVTFLQKPERLTALVRRGVLCSITAASLTGTFGGTVQRFARRLVAEGCTHNLASDGHSAGKRPPVLREGTGVIRELVRDPVPYVYWLTTTAPEAILAGRPLPAPPGVERLGPLRRALRRAGT